MAIISNFELLVKRIGPPSGPPAPFNAAFRRLLQGYYLTISNPNDRDVNLKARAVFPRINSSGKTSPFTVNERELVGGVTPNHVYAYDRTGDITNAAAAPRELLGALRLYRSKTESKTFETNIFSLDCNQTGLLNIVPKPSAAAVPNPEIEIRGYIRLIQTYLIRIIRRPNGLCLIVFTRPDPIDLLVTPEIRGTFLDDNYPSPGTLDFDQSNYALPTSTGSAMVRVEDIQPPFEVVPVDPIFPLEREEIEFDGLGSQIESESLSGKLNLAGQFSLDDKSIKYLQSLINKQKSVEYSLPQVVSSIEGTINRFGVIEEEEAGSK